MKDKKTKPLSIEEYKYKKIYDKKGVMTRAGLGSKQYGEDSKIDGKWDNYGRTSYNEYPRRQHYDYVIFLNEFYSVTSVVDVGCGYNEFLSAIKEVYYSSRDKDAKGKFVGVDVVLDVVGIVGV